MCARGVPGPAPLLMLTHYVSPELHVMFIRVYPRRGNFTLLPREENMEENITLFAAERRDEAFGRERCDDRLQHESQGAFALASAW